jgi:NAD(P)-dependent dehydrogenase (short-subunit alcohol dehydrogenase family)
MRFSGTPRRDLAWKRLPAAKLDLNGRGAAVVGGTGGIGRAIARRMATVGARVLVVGQTFRDQAASGLSFVNADLSLMAEARRVGRALSADLDVVVLTTGIMAGPTREETSEGLERDLAVSYLSRLVIVRELAQRLGDGRRQSGRRPRVFIMGMPGTDAKPLVGDLNAENGYSPMAVHMNTVAGNEALVLDSARRYPEVDFYGLNPGLIKTNIRSNMLGQGSWKHRTTEWLVGRLTMSAEQYAEGIVPLLFAPELDGHSGAMFNQKGIAIHSSRSLTSDSVRGLTAKAEALIHEALRDSPAN